jgi:ergothioneine biosynthesis protein EgtB
MPDASPSKWHLAHSSWFYETFILKYFAPNCRAFNPAFDYLFNSYYNGISQQYPRAQRNLLTRPSLEEVLNYRKHVDQCIMELLNSPLANNVELQDRLLLGINHEQQHQELLLTDIKHAFFHNPLYPAYQNSVQPTVKSSSSLNTLSFIDIHSTEQLCGYADEDFAFDNEGPCHYHNIHSHQLAQRLISNIEYQAFIDDGGYARPELWLSDGWACLQQQQWQRPLYWIQQEKTAYEFTLYGLQKVQADAPVCHISFYEADAFARWSKARLADEFELEYSLKKATETTPLSFHPGPMHNEDHGTGQCWEWSHSPYTAYPRYRTAAGAIGEYNGKFMCNQLVLRGSSCLTSPGHSRPSYRNFFYPQQRWQMTGIRLAKDSED